ncbi:MAG: Tetratricopeptide repeat, partial [Sphingomonadales bacterium]|nr:Tetratricopeptide repeat [Sphingomonadales bacterium]
PLDALAILDREAAGSAGRVVLLTVKGQLLERLGRATEAGLVYDEAVESGDNPDDKRAAWLLGAELALKRSDLAGALSRVQSAWAATPGDPDTVKLLAEAASLLGRGDLVLHAEREMQAAGTIDRATQESFGNALFRVGSYDLAASRFVELAGTATSPDEEYRLRRAAGFASQAGKDAARALFEFERAVAINPEPEALSAAVEAALQAGRLDVAATDLRRLADSSEGQDGVRALMRLSIVEEQNGHFPEALAALQAIGAGARDVEVERRSVALAAKTGNGEAALGSARRLARLEPTRVNLLALGEAEIAAGQPVAAVRSFEKALALRTEDDPGLREILANTLIAAGRPALAADQFDALATTANGARDEYRLRLAAGFAALKAGDRLRALARFRSAVNLEPNREALGAAAEAARAAGQLAEAAAYLERLARFGPTRANLRALGEAQLAAGKPDLAVESFDKALALEAEDDPALRKMLANTLAAAGQPARAVDEFDGLAAKASVPADEYRLRLASGFTALGAGDRERALAEFQRAIGLEPSREALAAAAETAIQTGRLAEAAGYFERLALDRKATSRARDLEHLSVVYEKMGKVREAAKALARLPKAEQSQPAIIRRRAVLAQKLGGRGAWLAHNAQPPTDPALSLGYAHQTAGQPGLAIVYFRRALAESRSLTAAQHRHVDAALGYAYAETGQHQQAAAYFEKALAAWPRQDLGPR